MKPRIVPLVLLALITTGFFGCATSSHRSARMPRPRSFALAVTVNGSLQPTPEQWSTIQAAFVRYLARRGWVLVTDLSLADHILRVDFTPDPEDPEERGHARVIGIRPNPTTMVASRGTAPLQGQFGYAFSMGQGWPYSNFYSSSFYGYGDYYYDGYTNGWGGVATTPIATTPRPPAHPPYRHPPDNDYCPPEHVRPSPGFVADHHSGNIGSNPVYDHPRPPPSDYRPSGSDRSQASRADRSYSQNDAAAYRSRESYSSSNYSSSEPSYYSPPSTSSSESSTSSAASMGAAASFGSAAASTPVTVMTR